MRQLKDKGLRPGGQPVAAQLLWASNRYHAPGGVRFGYLYREDLALPRWLATPCQLKALGKALAARRSCPRCQRDAGYDIPRKLGCGLECAGPWELDQVA